MLRRLAALAAAVLLGLVVAGCGESKTPQVTVMANDFAFAGPQTFAGGVAEFTLTNDGNEEHHLQLMRLNDGATVDGVMGAVAARDLKAMFSMASFEGGVGAISPGRTASAVLNLKPGNYLMVCLIPGADGVPHIAKGMLSPVTVAAAAGTQKLPRADGKATLKDFTFELPSIKAGKTSIEVVNEGPQPHELSVIALSEGKTAQDFGNWLKQPSGPPPGIGVGGINAIMPGGSGVAELDLANGNYIAVCMVPDPGSGTPHIVLGMIKEFQVK